MKINARGFSCDQAYVALLCLYHMAQQLAKLETWNQRCNLKQAVFTALIVICMGSWLIYILCLALWFLLGAFDVMICSHA